MHLHLTLVPRVQYITNNGTSPIYITILILVLSFPRFHCALILNSNVLLKCISAFAFSFYVVMLVYVHSHLHFINTVRFSKLHSIAVVCICIAYGRGLQTAASSC